MVRSLLFMSFILAVASPTLADSPVARPELLASAASSSLGPTDSPGAISPEPPRDWEYWQNCDGTFEQAYSWYGNGIQDPYYGAFAEGFHGPAQVRGMRVYATQIGFFANESMDLYIWGDGIGGPGCVLMMKPDVIPTNVPLWPSVGANDFEMDAVVGHDFYVGSQSNFQFLVHTPWWVAADESGPSGNPWTCIAPGLGYAPSGWQHPRVVFPECVSMGYGVYVEGTASVADQLGGDLREVSTTWGAIKELYGK